MNQIQIDFYYSPKCPHCATVLAVAEGMPIHLINIHEHPRESLQGIHSVPAVVVDGALLYGRDALERLEFIKQVLPGGGNDQPAGVGGDGGDFFPPPSQGRAVADNGFFPPP